MNDIRPLRLFNIYGFTGMSYAGNVWDKNGLSPTLKTMSGGNSQPLILEVDNVLKRAESAEIRPKDRDYNRKGLPRNPQLEIFGNGISYALRTGQQVKCVEVDEMDNVRIRKLTPTECYKLMGFTAEDCKKCSEGGISNSQLYKQAGNSIVVNVLEAIFTSLGERYEEFST